MTQAPSASAPVPSPSASAPSPSASPPRVAGIIVRLEMRDRPPICLGSPWPQAVTPPEPGREPVPQYLIATQVIEIRPIAPPVLGMMGRYQIVGRGTEISDFGKRNAVSYTYFHEDEVLRPHYMVPLSDLAAFLEQERDDYVALGFPDEGDGDPDANEPEEASSPLPSGLGQPGGPPVSKAFLHAKEALERKGT